jgi:4-hydroxy-tetrahydrodipicolinate reductase
MLKIGILGYGKMGKAIEDVATKQGIEIVWRIGHSNMHELTTDLLRKADVAIEFSSPEAAFDHVLKCLEAGVPVVSGTTGWNDKLPEAQAYCQTKDGALLWSSNFSIGVNVFFAVNRYLAKLMSDRPEYQPTITETHHIHKLDAPSGTAITLANELIHQLPRISSYQLFNPNASEMSTGGVLPVTAIRSGEIPGTHLVQWHSDVDDISIEHRAHSRAGFAWGAVAAARWIVDKRGVYSMEDLLNIQ